MKIKDVDIAGKAYPLLQCDTETLKRLPIGVKARFNPHTLSFNGKEMLVLIPRKDTRITPDAARKLSTGLEKTVGFPIVYLFENLAYYERDRLIGKNVYFMVSGKYVFIPYLLINAKPSTYPRSQVLNATSQYLILYHLQCKRLDGLTIGEIEQILPYKYVTLTRAIKELENFDLCFITHNLERKKTLHFPSNAQELWKRALPYLTNPVEKTVFADKVKDGDYVESGINALAHYSMLAEIDQKSYAMTRECYRNAELENANPIEGNVKVEVWKYPPIGDEGFADRLSLYLTLKDDPDARTEKELDKMITRIWSVG